MKRDMLCRHAISGRSLDLLAAGLLERRQELMRGKASTISAAMYACGRLGRDPAPAAPGRAAGASLVQELLSMVGLDMVAAKVRTLGLWGCQRGVLAEHMGRQATVPEQEARAVTRGCRDTAYSSLGAAGASPAQQGLPMVCLDFVGTLGSAHWGQSL